MSTENPSTVSNVTPLGAYVFRIVIGLFLVALLLAYGMTFQVNEGTQTVVTRFDRPMRTLDKAGLYWKLPWPIEKSHFINMRKRIFNTPQTTTLTKEQTPIQLLTYVVWKVSDPLLYLESLGRGETFYEKDLVAAAEKALETKVVDGKNRIVGNFNLSSLISVNEKEIHAEEIERMILNEIKKSVLKDYGIDVLQVGIKRLSVPEENMKAILQSMKEERVKQAGILHAEGVKAADIIKKDADLKAEELKTAGRIEAGKIKGEAELEAAKIETEANSFAPEFYTFWRSMKTLRTTLSGNATIVLRNDNEFFKLLFENPNKTSGGDSRVLLPTAPSITPVVPTPAPTSAPTSNPAPSAN